MQIPVGWANKETLKWLFYLTLAATVFGAVSGVGLAVFHLFGANPLWLVIFLLGVAVGYGVYSLCPPPIMGLLIEITELLEELLNLPLAIAASPQPSSPVAAAREDISAVTIFRPAAAPLIELFDFYLVEVPGSDKPYLKTWDENSIEFTDSIDEAYRFSRPKRAWTLACLTYVTFNAQICVEVKGVPLELAGTKK